MPNETEEIINGLQIINAKGYKKAKPVANFFFERDEWEIETEVAKLYD